MSLHSLYVASVILKFLKCASYLQSAFLNDDDNDDINVSLAVCDSLTCLFLLLFLLPCCITCVDSSNTFIVVLS
jgi:hypothetical protein